LNIFLDGLSEELFCGEDIQNGVGPQEVIRTKRYYFKKGFFKACIEFFKLEIAVFKKPKMGNLEVDQ
jgi:hypothetical protein